MLASRKTTKLCFYLYLVVLVWAILFKFETDISRIPFFMSSYRFVNFIPFSQPLIINGQVIYEEMLFNLLLFIPFGVCLPLLKLKWSWVKILGLGILLSLFFEMAQWFWMIGMADATDLLLNGLGVLLGMLLYSLLKLFFKERTLQIVNGCALFVSVFFLAVALFLLRY